MEAICFPNLELSLSLLINVLRRHNSCLTLTFMCYQLHAGQQVDPIINHLKEL
jgi:hypothetical protein